MDKKKNPNILLIIIDSLRSDRISKEQKFTQIPNISNLINQGTIFTQVISTSDVTGTCLGSLFSGSYPFETGITQTSIDYSKMNYLKSLKENNYKLFAAVPKFTLFKKIIENFDEVMEFDHTKWKEEETIFGQTASSVKNFIKKNMNEKGPWFQYLHLIDIHGFGKLVNIPKDFDNEKDGKTKYDRLLSAIDSWLENILKEISMEETIVVITSDHGEYLDTQSDLRDMPNFYKFMRKMKKNFPQFQSIGEKVFVSVLSINEKINLKAKNIDLENEKQFIPRGYTKYLYDDAFKIPLIISGYNSPKNKEVKKLVRQIDIFETIFGLANINIGKKGSGEDILKNEIKERVAYIEGGSSKPKILGKTIGIRTESFKYFRSRIDKNADVYLFNLKNDPKERENIAKKEIKLVKELETILENIIKNSEEQTKIEISDEEKMIEEELKKMGYL